MQWFIDTSTTGPIPAGSPRWGKAKPLDLWTMSADEIRDELHRLIEACGSGSLLMKPTGAEQISEVFGTRLVIEHPARTEGEAVSKDDALGNGTRHSDEEARS
ncbi:hypothetical protein ACFYUD_31720 [Nocardia tengchongensis]|uniref:hypothetical protein n=1 Tax=Nocardia tengchongensis TaxID=2055889 RepID=UPI0036ADB9E7